MHKKFRLNHISKGTRNRLVCFQDAAWNCFHICFKQPEAITAAKSSSSTFPPPRVFHFCPRASPLVSAPASVQAHGKQLFQSLLQLLWSFLVPCSVPLQTLLRFGDAENCVSSWQRGCSEGLCQQQNVPPCLLLHFPPEDTEHFVGFFLLLFALWADECELPVTTPRSLS